MKLVKMSLAAVMLLGASAYAEVKNVKFDGQAKLIYQTADWELTTAEEATDVTSELFNQGDLVGAGASYGGTAGGASMFLGMTGEVNEGIQFGLQVQAVSSLGLENNLVNNVMYSSSELDAWNVSEAYLAKTMSQTTVKVGRQELNTPLLFTEKWNLAKNTFEALAVVNTDIEDTTLVGAWVGKHNGVKAGFTAALDNGIDGGSSPFNTLGVEGAYAFGVVNTSLQETKLQAWYYDVVNLATGFWLQADTKALEVVSIGAQYAYLNQDAGYAAANLGDNQESSSIFAIKVGGEIQGINLFAAYSSADEDGALGFQNVSTEDKTQIYTGTASIYMDGIVTLPGTEAIKVGVSGKLSDVKLAANYTTASDVAEEGDDISAFDVSASTTIAGLGLTAIYTQVTNDTGDVDAAGTVRQYAGRDNNTLRIIASMKF